MRTKYLGGGRRRPSAAATHDSHATVRKIPLLHTQGECNAALLETSTDSGDDDPRDVPMVGSDVNMADCNDDSCNKIPHDVLNHDSHDYVDLLDKKVCICCNEGGRVLVCSETGCPITLHAKCISFEPKFDDFGKFYCPYCWYKQAVEKCQELRTKAMIAKNALSKFLDKNVVTSDKLVQKDEAAEREERLSGDRITLDGSNGDGTRGPCSQPLQREGHRLREMHKAASDPYEIAVEGQACTDYAATNVPDSAGEIRACSEGEVPAQIKQVEDSRNCRRLGEPKIPEKHETRFVEDKENVETEHPGHNKEEVPERIVEIRGEAEPLSASMVGKHNDEDSPGIAFAKGMQESVALSAENKGRRKDRGKAIQRGLEASATCSSVSETNDSDFEAPSLKKGHAKGNVQKTAHRQKVCSGRQSPFRKCSAAGKNDCYINEEVTSSKNLRQAQRSPQQVKMRTSLNAQRKRLRWTAEEENTLKEGVLRFSKENHNIPWRKVLEFGCDVFDKTRTPVDLKDKWKNITRQGSNGARIEGAKETAYDFPNFVLSSM